MINILLSGVSGAMGATLQQIIAANPDTQVVAGFDQQALNTLPFPVYNDLTKCTEAVDVIIDFSHFAAFPAIFGFARSHKIPIVIATTGLSEADLAAIDEGAIEFPVFKTANLSLGINLIAKMLTEMVAKLESGFDIEIIEKHHNQKIDAPSGTALMLADAICEEIDKPMKYEYDRHSKREKRSKNEIGMHAVRGGTIVGEHEIIFAGRDEIITLSHSARSKEIFAVGAVNAAKYMVGKGAGLYTMKDLIK